MGDQSEDDGPVMKTTMPVKASIMLAVVVVEGGEVEKMDGAWQQRWQ